MKWAVVAREAGNRTLKGDALVPEYFAAGITEVDAARITPYGQVAPLDLDRANVVGERQPSARSQGKGERSLSPPGMRWKQEHTAISRHGAGMQQERYRRAPRGCRCNQSLQLPHHLIFT
jgi:hypothetical protein